MSHPGCARHVLLTGPPGIGKTSVVIKVRDMLLSSTSSLPLFGFVTEEVRQEGGGEGGGGRRTGFQVVTLNGQTAPLASITSSSPHRVGRYGVHLTEFENTVLPSIQIPSSESITATGGGGGILIMDEIGGMELKSIKFQEAVEEAFNHQNIVILATIPVANQLLPFVETIRGRKDVQIFSIHKSNRDSLPQIIFNILTSPKINK